MKASSLRLGNWVYYDGRDCSIQEPTDLIDADEFKPIPLTEDWLVKFGFKGDDNSDKYLDVNSYCYLHLRKGWDVVYLYDEDSDNEITNVKHVHQLQNLYFALVGEELTIK